MARKMHNGKQIALRALAGEATERPPVFFFVCRFDYLWKVAGLEPWRLACGGNDTWLAARMALIERHCPDLIEFDINGEGPEEPTLLEEDSKRWM